MKALNINTRNKMNTLKQQAGMTLTESLLVLAVGALVAVLAYGGYKMAVGNVNEQAAVDSSARMLSAIKKSFGSSGNYTTSVTTANLATSGIVPTEFKIVGGEVVAPWGSGTAKITIAGTGTATAPVNTVPVTFTNVPTNICLSLMAGIEGFTESMTVAPAAGGGTPAPVKTQGGKFDSGLAAANCGADANIVATIK